MSQPRCYFIGNTHIDHTWVWNWTEGYDEVVASFASALERMEEFPEFVFTASSTLHYRWVEENDPELFERIRQRVAEGRWQLAGGWVVQSDDNIPAGEAFVRQGLYGQRYFRARFGKQARVGYCVDSFGHHGQLPQILRLQGLEGWLHFRPSREELPLPDGPYRWRGIDGTEVVASRPPGWYCTPDDRWFERATAALPDCFPHYPEALVFYGVGDHGGGPTIRDIERARRFRDEHPEVECVFGGLDEFYDRAGSATGLPLVEGDLQHSFRGCYTAHSPVKSLSRRGEARLLMAEKAAALAVLMAGAPYPKAELDRAWDHLLTNHFHDVICGTCAPGSMDEAIYRAGGVLETADRVRHFALGRISRRLGTLPPARFDRSVAVCVFNSLSWDRREPLALHRTMMDARLAGPGSQPALVDADGPPVDTQRIEPPFGTPDWPKTFLFSPCVPAGGVALYHLVDDRDREPPATDLRVTESELESRSWRMRVDPTTGTLTSLFDRRTGTELVPPGAGGADLLVMRDLGDTWGTGRSHFEDLVGRFAPVSVRAVESGPLRARLEIRGEYEGSRSRLLVSLYRDFDWVDFELEMVWTGRFRMVKIAFPLAVTAARARFEIPYGAIERPLDGAEQPFQRWVALQGIVRATAGGERPCAAGIAADSIGGADVRGTPEGSEIRLSLLRSPFYGYLTSGLGGAGGDTVEDQARAVTDQGVRQVRFSLAVAATESDLGLPDRAEQLAQPLQVVFEGRHSGEALGAASYFRCEPATVHLTALKQAEDGSGFVVRLVETRGEASPARVVGPAGLPPIETRLRPYEIQTWRWRPDRAPELCDLLEDSASEQHPRQP
jgi:alpha-mannosidase